MPSLPTVVLNPGAGGGRAARRWAAIESEVAKRIGPYELVTADRDSVGSEIGRRLRMGCREFVAAGGDGTVNLLLNALVTAGDASMLDGVALGAVGLGSSNDFHKPRVPENVAQGVPLRLDRAGGGAHDIGRLRYSLEPEREQIRFWIINASIGTTAEANRRFNAPGRVLRLLRRVSPWRGITWAALRTIVGYRSRRMTVVVDGRPPRTVLVKNLGVVKNPHFSGDLCYGSPYEPASGHFFVHLLEHVPAPRLVLTLAGLLRGRFPAGRHAHSWRARRLLVTAAEPFAVELDGEVVSARRAEFDLLPFQLQVCR